MSYSLNSLIPLEFRVYGLGFPSRRLDVCAPNMSYNLNSLNACYIVDYIGDYYGFIKGVTRSVDYSSCAKTLDSCTPVFGGF